MVVWQSHGKYLNWDAIVGVCLLVLSGGVIWFFVKAFL